MKVILGSRSPRRKDLLKNIVKNFIVISPEVKEEELPGELPQDFTRRISKLKAISIITNYKKHDEPHLLITSDTIVSIDNKIIGKPSDHNDAIKKLALLNNRTHRVITAITLSYINNNHEKCITSTECEITEVTFKNLSQKDIELYLGKINYLDKAGSYAIQEFGETIIIKIHGSLTNVIGFPLRLFFRMTNDIGVMDNFI